MPDAPKYKSLAEKFEAITRGKRQRPEMVWLTNQTMNELDANWENPVLVEVPAKQFAKPGNPFLKQGYSRYVHAKPAPAPTEAKAVVTNTTTTAKS